MGSVGCRDCCQGLKEEFQLKKFGVNHSDPSLFVKPQFFRPVVYIYWVVLWTLFYIAMLMLDVYYNRNEGSTWFIYLTNISYLVQAISVVLDCGVTVYVNIRRTDIRDGLGLEVTWYIRVLWVMFNISIAASVLVTLLYYTLLSPEFSHGSVNKHLLNSVYTVLLLMFTAKPVQILHVYQPMIYAILYAVFSVIYQEAGNDAIYDPLDWDKTGSTWVTVILAVFVGIPIVHLFCFALYTLRLHIWRKCRSRSVSISDVNDSIKTHEQNNTTNGNKPSSLSYENGAYNEDEGR